ncbi:MAG: ABC transporter permease, partial [Bdellovibrionales bacterium]
MYPIIHRELLELLRTKKILGLQILLALAALMLVLVRWPTGAVADLNGARSMQVLRILGYGLLACIILLVPAVPSATLVREKLKGTLPLLLNSPLSPWAIYLGKLGGVLGFTAILLIMTLPAAAACYALGGTGTRGGIIILYAIFGMATLQLATLSLLVSSYSQSTDGALRTSYSLVLALCIVPLGLHALVRVGAEQISTLSGWLRCISPIPPVMEILGHGDVGMQGLTGVGADAVTRYALLASLCSILFAVVTILRLQSHLLDRARSSGVMTQDRSRSQRTVRRFLFLVDPQRRSSCQSLWVNPILVKEF